METKVGRDGGPGLWSYRRNQQITESSNSVTMSSSSGTIVSTTYAASSAASRLSSVSHSLGADLLMELEIRGDETMSGQEIEEQRMRHIQSLAQEFFVAPSSNCIGDMSVLEGWLAELGVGWVFHSDTAVDASESASWMRAFTQLMRAITMAWPQFLKDEPKAERGTQPIGIQIEQFFEQTMLKMLTFVDVTAEDIITNRDDEVHPKLRTLLQVHSALSDAAVELRSLSLLGLLLAKRDTARNAICTIVDRARACVLGPMEVSSVSQTAQASSDIHRLTWSVAANINFLHGNRSTIELILVDAEMLSNVSFVPQTRSEPLLNNIIKDMIACLNEKLVNMSESFSDLSHMLLFLLNNSDFILESLPSHPLGILHSISKTLTHKVNAYMESYLQMSWAPLLSCLLNPTPLCLFGKYHYPLALPKFESDFQKMYATQRLWKVPNPKMRRSLRTAVKEKIIPGYTRYIEDNKVTTPKFTPKVLEEMFEELFEG